MDESDYMQRAIELARRGAGLVSPNPMVGAVLVRNDHIVGEGYHRYDWLRHAEYYAIEMAGELARGATLYCSLEPCCHYGRTPPCTDAVIEAGIARAVVAMSDPDPRVSGCGLEQLRAAGIEVEVGLCENEARRLNEAYLKFITRETPFIHGVVQQSLDVEWKPSPRFLQLASEYDAIVLGQNVETNHLILKNSLSRARHRPLVVAGSINVLKRAGVLDPAARDESRWMLIEILTSLAESDRAFNRSDLVESAMPRAGGSNFIEHDIDSILRALARLRVTSALMLPQQDELARSVIEESDRVTTIAPKTESDIDQATWLAHSVIGADIEEVEVLDAGVAIEVTAYSRRNV